MSNRFECPKCHASVLFHQGDAVARCPQCGAAYKLHPRRAAQPVLMPPAGRGVTDYLTVPNDSLIRNRPLLQCYLPKGWQYQCLLVDNRFDLVSNPFVAAVILTAPCFGGWMIWGSPHTVPTSAAQLRLPATGKK